MASGDQLLQQRFPNRKSNAGHSAGPARMRDELLNETLFFTVRQARSILARCVDDYNTERPHSALGYATPAAFAAELEKQQAGLNPPVASPALLRDNNGRSLVAAG
jgi:putative transposase